MIVISKNLVLVPCPVSDESFSGSDLSFLEYSCDDKSIPENFVFIPGPKF